jgi:hypothetical protein
MLGNFFIWCAGSDKKILSQCEESVRTKHIGIGTLVLIPAVLGFISMTYALSTIDKINNSPLAYIIGGLIWGLIVFSFDRFIVSTHKKQQNNVAEFKSITFYLRLVFAIVLGIVISHPLVLLNFEGSITERIISDRDKTILQQESNYQKSYDKLTANLNGLVQRKQCNEQLLTAEQSGTKVVLNCGSSSGIPNVKGSFPRTKEIKNILKELQISINKEQLRIDNYNKTLNRIKESTQNSIVKNTSFDYLKREKTLAQLKKENPIVGITEFFLMLVFILVDVLPLVFKTFSPFTMYDKIVYDDIAILKQLNTDGRKNALQNQYNKIVNSYHQN